MSFKRIIACLTVLAFAAVVPLAAKQSITAHRDIYVAAGETQDNVIAFGGNVTVEGRVKDTVLAFGGTVVINGEVGHAVVGFGSRITLKSTAVVRGDVVSLGGVLDKEPGCTIAGDTVYFKASELGGKLFKGRFTKGIFGYPLFPLFLVLSIIGAFLWLIAALVLAAIFPNQIARASAELHKAFWPTFGTGLLAIVIYIGMVIVAALLCFILIGIPIALALAFAGFVVKVFGRVALFFFLGQSLLKSMRAKEPSVIGAVLVGLLLVTIIGFIPFIGALFGFVLSILGWGITLRTRFGTSDSWFRRK